MPKYSQKSKGVGFSLSHIGFKAAPAAICAPDWYLLFAVLAVVFIALYSIEVIHLPWVIFKRHIKQVFAHVQTSYSLASKSS